MPVFKFSLKQPRFVLGGEGNCPGGGSVRETMSEGGICLTLTHNVLFAYVTRWLKPGALTITQEALLQYIDRPFDVLCRPSDAAGTAQAQTGDTIAELVHTAKHRLVSPPTILHL